MIDIDPFTGKKMVERPFFVNGGSLYISCRNRDGIYYFCHGFAGKPIFQQSVEGIVPRMLQVRDGSPIALVGIPIKEELEKAPLLDAKSLYTEIDEHLKKYLDAPDIDRQMFIYYILFSWLYIKTNTAPYLRFIADTGNGKSRMQKVIGELCFFPIRANGASSPSGIMRIKEKWHGTLLIDEADLRESTTTNELVKYLNLGFEKGQFFIKSDKDRPKDQDVFDPYCPKVISMRVPFQDNATEGRLLSFTPKETQRRDLPIILPDLYDQDVEQLRAKIAYFILVNFEKVGGEKLIDLSEMDIEPRIKQLALPLSIVLQLFPDGETRFKEYLTIRQQEVKKVRAASYEGMVFNSVLDWSIDNPARVTPSGIYEKAGVKSAQAVSRILHSIGFKTELVKQDKTLRILVVPDERTWTGICQRYYYSDQSGCPPCPESLRSSRWVATQKTLA